MKPTRISKEEVRAICSKYGIKEAGPYHPAYSEGPSIMFLRRIPDSSGPKVIDSPQDDSRNDSDTPNENQE